MAYGNPYMDDLLAMQEESRARTKRKIDEYNKRVAQEKSDTSQAASTAVKTPDIGALRRAESEAGGYRSTTLENALRPDLNKPISSMDIDDRITKMET